MREGVGTGRIGDSAGVFIDGEVGSTSRRRSSEDSDGTLEVDEGSDSRHRYHPGSHDTSGYGSLASGERRAESVAWKTPRGHGSSRVLCDDNSEEDRSSGAGLSVGDSPSLTAG